jgi:hypothetical protein
MEPNGHAIVFNDLAEKTQGAVAQIIKDDTETRTGIVTKDVSEWVRVMAMGNTMLLIDPVTRKMNIEANSKSKQLLELLVKQYLLVGLKEGGPADG